MLIHFLQTIQCNRFEIVRMAKNFVCWGNIMLLLNPC